MHLVKIQSIRLLTLVIIAKHFMQEENFWYTEHSDQKDQRALVTLNLIFNKMQGANPCQELFCHFLVFWSYFYGHDASIRQGAAFISRRGVY